MPAGQFLRTCSLHILKILSAARSLPFIVKNASTNQSDDSMPIQHSVAESLPPYRVHDGDQQDFTRRSSEIAYPSCLLTPFRLQSRTHATSLFRRCSVIVGTIVAPFRHMLCNRKWVIITAILLQNISSDFDFECSKPGGPTYCGITSSS